MTRPVRSTWPIHWLPVSRGRTPVTLVTLNEARTESLLDANLHVDRLPPDGQR